MSIADRAYAGPADLAAMQDLVSRSWLADRPLVNCTAGGLEWWLTNDPDAARPDTVRLWWDADELVGWSWLDPPAALDWHLRTDLRGGPVQQAMLDWFHRLVADAVLPPDEQRLRVWVMDTDRPTLALVHHAGYRPGPKTFRQSIHPLVSVETATVPDGYRLRTVRWPEDLPARVDVHRAAFDPSRMTTAKYGLLPARRLYAAERDWVVEAPDGTFAAFALGWFDPIARVGELEPVGTHPEHRRKGLGRAVCLAAVASLKAAGAEEVLVFSAGDDIGSGRLYASVGFEPVTIHRGHDRPTA